MKYRANPVEVTAHRIISVGPPAASEIWRPDGTIEPEGSRHLVLENGKGIIATPEQLARMVPLAGDYVVIQEDGYTYLNPREVFERKYSAAA